MPVQSINAVTLAVRNMALALDFYRDQVGLPLLYGDETASFSSFKIGDGYLNLVLIPEGGWSWWGRVIFYVATCQRLVSAGLSPSTVPENAPWNERYFHIKDPDGHELSFAGPPGA
jgi:catechol 2,3-dioxygenase-like lactoylglutathione lyase family enzyme